jgi:hypothetical protein
MCASVKLELSGRLRGVNMARKLKWKKTNNNNIESQLLNLPNIVNNKDINIKTEINNIINNIELNDWSNNSINTHKMNENKSNINVIINNPVKPQTINNIGTYRLQYIKKWTVTKWGKLGLKLWLMQKS